MSHATARKIPESDGVKLIVSRDAAEFIQTFAAMMTKTEDLLIRQIAQDLLTATAEVGVVGEDFDKRHGRK